MSVPWFPSRNVSLPAEGSSLPACEGFLAERSLQQLLTYANNVSNWISAEIIICDSVKVRGEKKRWPWQTALLWCPPPPTLFWVMSVPTCASYKHVLHAFRGYINWVCSSPKLPKFSLLMVLLIRTTKTQVSVNYPLTLTCPALIFLSYYSNYYS